MFPFIISVSFGFILMSRINSLLVVVQSTINGSWYRYDSMPINNNIQNECDMTNNKSYILMNEHTRNRHKCYGYSQAEILYEEDEYTDDSNSGSTDNNCM